MLSNPERSDTPIVIICKTAQVDIFVYGTLTEASTVEQVLDGEPFSFDGQAVLKGVHRVECEYPTLMPGGETHGRILQTDAVGLLDQYEGVTDELYTRQSVPVADRPATADVYIGDPNRLNCEENSWPHAQTFVDSVTTYLTEQNVVII